MRTCHSLGLNFSRAEGLAQLSQVVAQESLHTARALLAKAEQHFQASLPFVNSGGWMADHWICTFGILAAEAYEEAAAQLSPKKLGPGLRSAKANSNGIAKRLPEKKLKEHTKAQLKSKAQSKKGRVAQVKSRPKLKKRPARSK